MPCRHIVRVTGDDTPGIARGAKNLKGMQASNRNQEEKPPNVLYVVLASLFGYPGAGHLMVGQKRTGAIFAVTFTITTVAMVVEAVPFLISLIRQLTAAINDGIAPPLAPISLPRLALWTVLSLILWAASAVNAAKLAKRAGQEMASRSSDPNKAITEAPTESQIDTSELQPEDPTPPVETTVHEKGPE